MTKKTLGVFIAAILSACGGNQQNPDLSRFIPEQLPKPSPSPTQPPAPTPTPTATATPTPPATAKIYQHPVYGKYIKAAEFGVDTSGKTNASDDLDKALAFAQREKVAVQITGTVRINRPIVLNAENAGITALFGEGMGRTTLKFAWNQDGDYRTDSRDSNELDVSQYAGIVVSGRDTSKIADTKTTLAEFSLVYDKTDNYYLYQKSYFGKVNGIYVDDSDNVHINNLKLD